ncbi:Fic/DOC family protein [Gluconobacter oxydans]|uniref:Fic/DOC family protein n=1 Tax=Gluconobacter oxydans TaxID=442 RepID=UPI0039E95FC8
MADPYLQDDGATLKNKLGIIGNPQRLREAEAVLVALRESELHEKGFSQAQGQELVKAIHHHLFQDVYDWAGVPRITPLFKYNHAGLPGGTSFVPPQQIETETHALFGRLAAQNNLKGLETGQFAAALAQHFVDLNHIHAFREGNGRTQTLLWRKIARDAGHELSFSQISRERMVAVSIAGENGNRDAVQRMMTELLDPIRYAALERATGFLERAFHNGSRVDWHDRYIATTTPGQHYEGTLVGKSRGEFMLASQDRIYVGWARDLPQDGTQLKPGDPVSFEAARDTSEMVSLMTRMDDARETLFGHKAAERSPEAARDRPMSPRQHEDTPRRADDRSPGMEP